MRRKEKDCLQLYPAIRRVKRSTLRIINKAEHSQIGLNVKPYPLQFLPTVKFFGTGSLYFFAVKQAIIKKLTPFPFYAK